MCLNADLTDTSLSAPGVAEGVHSRQRLREGHNPHLEPSIMYMQQVGYACVHQCP